MGYLVNILSVNSETRSASANVEVNDFAFEEQNTGHIKITASITGRMEGTYSIECDVTNPNGNMPACYLSTNDGVNAGGNAYPYYRFKGGLIDPTGDLVCSNIVNTNWNSNTIAGFGPINNIFSNILWSWGAVNINAGDVIDTVVDISIDADFPIFGPDLIDNTGYNWAYSLFKTMSSVVEARDYALEVARDGIYDNLSEAVNYISADLNSIPQDLTYYIKSSLKVNGHMTTQKGYCFQILPTAKICLYQDDSPTGNASPNLHLIISNFPCYVKGYDDPDTDYVEVNTVDTNYWHSGYWRDLNTGVNYTGICSTNIPIFRGQENAQKYLDGELSKSDALNGGIFANKDSTIGEELTSSDIPTVNLSTSGIGSFAYALSASQLTQIMENYLFTDDTTLQDTMKDALWAWGNNPIDFLIDCYYIPFSITHFYDTINANLKFGTYQFPGTSYPAIKETNGDRLVLFNTTFEGVYGDWRDFTQFNYDLFLPYIGFVPLDIQKYLNKQVRCEMMFDLTTHNLRYYLFVDNKITDRFDGSVGINIPLMATDIVNKAKHDRDIKYGLVSDAFNLSGSIGQVAAGDLAGVATGINSILGGIKKYQELNNRATSNVNGSFSSSMNVYDITYAYLRITERQMIIPSELNSVYNFPSYYIGTLGSLSGYCEIDDIQLKSNCSEIEYNEIKNLLKEGVIF